jgi:hypothetical protein
MYLFWIGRPIGSNAQDFLEDRNKLPGSIGLPRSRAMVYRLLRRWTTISWHGFHNWAARRSRHCRSQSPRRRAATRDGRASREDRLRRYKWRANGSWPQELWQSRYRWYEQKCQREEQLLHSQSAFGSAAEVTNLDT